MLHVGVPLPLSRPAVQQARHTAVQRRRGVRATAEGAHLATFAPSLEEDPGRTFLYKSTNKNNRHVQFSSRVSSCLDVHCLFIFTEAIDE